MYRLVYFTVALCLAGVYTADDFQECMKLIEPEAKNSSCCQLEPIKKEFIDKLSSKNAQRNFENYDECNDLPDDGSDCSEKQTCIAKKAGLMKDNGDIDKEAVNAIMKEKTELILLPEVYRKIIKCLDEDLSKFETDESCYYGSLGKCMEIKYVMGCVEWSDEKSCSEMKNSANICAKMLS